MALAGALTTSCFYDSRWGEKQRLQEAAVRRVTPPTLQPTGDPEGSDRAAPVRVMRINAYATARHATELVGWPRQLRDIVDYANVLLEPTLHVRLEVAETSVWSTDGDEQDLSAMLRALPAQDAGDSADWVIGLVGSVPRAEMSFHEIGMSNRSGKHIVLRAMSDATELDALRKHFDWLDDEARSKLHAARKRHKRTAVLLHEIAHTLGVIHQRDAASIMNPSYSADAQRFSPEAVEWMKASLRFRGVAKPPDGPSLQDVVLDLLQRTADVWVPSERDELIAALSAAKARSAPPPAAPATSHRSPLPPVSSASPGAAGPGAEASGGPSLPALSAADQALFTSAEAKEKAGKPLDAWTSAKPLFSRYPDVYAVQELRCRLAMSLYQEDESTFEAECAPLRRLSAPAKKP
jgi:hypothetical protein